VLWGTEVAGTGSGSCAMAAFGISGSAAVKTASSVWSLISSLVHLLIQ
jgi:hypothetical protein